MGVTEYTAVITSVWDGDHTGLHLNLRTESQSKPTQANRPLSFVKPGPKSTKVDLAMLPNLPEMVSDEESQKTARKSALLVARMRDGSFRADVLVNLDENGSGYTSKNMFENCKSDIEFVQVMVVIDARPNIKVNAISHKQFVEYVGTHDVAGKSNIEEVPFAKEFEFRAEAHSMETAEKEICKTLRLKDCLAWYLRYDAINKMIVKLMEDINANKGRAAYTGKGGDETDKFLASLAAMTQKYKAPKFWIMLEKEFKDDKDKLV